MTEPTSAEERVGQVGGIVKLVSSLTLTQVLVIALLVMIAIPTYIAWRVINDASMLTKFTSHYEEISSDKLPCTLRIASLRGGGESFSISTGLSAQGSDRWTLAVLMNRRPNETELQTYCETLQILVDHIRRPTVVPPPTFPNSDVPLVWPYPPAEQL